VLLLPTVSTVLLSDTSRVRFPQLTQNESVWGYSLDEINAELAKPAPSTPVKGNNLQSWGRQDWRGMSWADPCNFRARAVVAAAALGSSAVSGSSRDSPQGAPGHHSQASGRGQVAGRSIHLLVMARIAQHPHDRASCPLLT